MTAYIAITSDPLDSASVQSLIESVPEHSDGGMVVFLGIVRDTARGKRIRYLEYDAYGEMAEQEMAAIAREVERRWATNHLAMVHRVGRIEVGECSVAIIVACEHRAEAFAACQYAIDTLKSTVPIFKKEVAEDGESWVEG